MPTARPPGRLRGPLRAAVAVLVAGFLVVWLIKPIGNPCPDLSRLPQGSTARSSPSFSPPGTRLCRYTASGGTQAQARYVPWLDWIVLVLLGALAAGAVRLASPAARAPRAEGVRGVSEPHPPKPHTPPERLAHATRGDAAHTRPPASPPQRDAAERERARRERAERDRR